MAKQHFYHTQLTWTGNTGAGTTNYRAYERSYSIVVEGKPALLGSSDPSFRGDKHKYNPEELLLASLSSCHMLWYLHLCASNKIVVVDYKDQASGIMEEKANGSGYFSKVVLKPEVTIQNQANADLANQLHHQANQMCFIANSMNFPVLHESKINLSN